MKVIVNFGEKKVVVPCGTNGDISIRELIHLATAKYRKLSAYNNAPSLNSDQVQLRLNNGAVVDPDDQVCDIVDDREELFAVIDSHPTILNSNGELSSSITSSNLSTSLSEHERPGMPPPPPISSSNNNNNNNRHEVIVTDADLRTRSLRIKTESNNNLQQNRPRHSPLAQSSDTIGMFDVHIDERTGDKIFSVLLPKENSPLGIHVIPCNSNEDRVNGLILQNIENDGRIKRQGILEINDRIIEINRINIEQCSFEKAQLIFRNALLESELELRVIRNLKKVPTSFYLNKMTSPELNQNTKRLGKLIKIVLIKGNDGLGFKLASRDNPTGIANPIYVKTIFPKGAAIEDGRLHNGDRLLTVNSIDVTQMSLQETVGLLRETRIGDTVHLCISRQHDGSLPKDLINDEIKTQIMTFDIPLRDTSSAGLGITLKGKTSIIDGQSIDLGIFVKSILTGGAAYRDNRLRSNDQILVINDSSLINISNLEAATILHDAVRKEIQPGYIKITISRVLNNNQDKNINNVKEIDLLLPSLTINNDENELDLTTFVSAVNRKPSAQQSKSIKSNESDLRSISNQSPVRNKITLNEKQNQNEVENESVNPFERETPFRQSISEKRRLTQQPNTQAAQWKQRSFHEDRTNSERRPSTRVLPDSSNIIRSSSFESLHRTPEEHRQSSNNNERKRHSKSRNRACNDSFRQAVDKSYCQNNTDELTNGDKSNKTEKQRFKFSNLFSTKSKRKENQEEKPSNQTIKSVFIQHQTPTHDNHTTFYPPPPAQFSSRQDSPPTKSQNNDRSSTNFVYPTSNPKPQGYQPYRFDSNQMSHNQQLTDRIPPTRYESQIAPDYPSKHHPGKSSLSINLQKPSHPPIPRQFLQSNPSGTQSLKQHQPSSRSPYPPTFTVQSNQLNSYSQKIDFPMNTSQRTGYTATPIYPTSRAYLQFENPANV